ncbi:MAG TPA: hypothetical protein VKM55_12615 [Candidatus Lokiarchaeia archaeon]|nr:hypothetical protein [Candidatus Lokiarchaeia archaeon]
MIWLVLAESALEIVPESIRNHPSVLADAHHKNKTPDKVLLDTNYHHSAMTRLPFAEKRGRPDLVHFCVLNAMKTPLNNIFKSLRVCIHVQFPNEKMIMIDPETRIPRSLNRFEGVIANALAPGKNTPELFIAEETSLASFLDRFEPRLVHVFSTMGTLRSFDRFLPDLADLAMKGEHDACLVVGGFQAGHFSGTWQDQVLPDHLHSIAPMALDAWTVVARVVYMVEEAIVEATRNPSCRYPVVNE